MDGTRQPCTTPPRAGNEQPMDVAMCTDGKGENMTDTKVAEDKREYTLVIAIHRGTLTSRDVEQPKRFGTEKEALQELVKARGQYRRLGYQIWFATLTDPDGNESTLESNPYT